MVFVFQYEKRKKTKLAYQNLRSVPAAIRLAQKMGKSMGRGEIL
jgi:hypothetical protein